MKCQSEKEEQCPEIDQNQENRERPAEPALNGDTTWASLGKDPAPLKGHEPDRSEGKNSAREGPGLLAPEIVHGVWKKAGEYHRQATYDHLD